MPDACHSDCLLPITKLSLPALALLFVALLPAVALAGVITVGPVSCSHTDLAGAVTAANPGDEIRIHKDYSAATNVRIEKSLTIVGGLPHCFATTPETATSFSALTSASPAPRQVLDVRGAGVDVTLYHLHLSGATNLGGLNVQDGARVRAGGVTISDNSALFGGGAWVHGNGSMLLAVPTPFTSNLTALDIHDNQASQGGGVYVGSGALLQQDAMARTVQIGNNGTLNLGGNSGRGGGLFVQAGGHASGINGLFGNTALLGGGAYVEGRASGAAVDGGVDLAVVGTLNLNSAGSGGGVYVAASDEVVVALDRLFQNNAGSEGGGLWFGSGGSADVRVVEDNSSNGVGGGIHQQAGSLRIREQLIENSANGNGGGIHATGGERSFDGGVDIARNLSGADGGALWALADGGSRLPGNQADAGNCDETTPCRISANEADGDGGAFYLEGSGLGIFASSDGATHGLQVDGNHSGAAGGAIHATAGSVVRVSALGIVEPGSASVWQANTAIDGGGAVALSNSDMVITGALFGGTEPSQANTALSGGGFYVAGVGSSGLGQELRVLNSRLNGNNASLRGGAIFAVGGARIEIGTSKCSASSLPADRYCSEINGNAAAQGSAIYTLGGSLELRSTAISGNLGSDADSAALALNGQGEDSILENVLLAGNSDHAIRIGDLAAGGSPVLLASMTAVDHVGAAVVLADEPGVSVDFDNVLLWANGLQSVDGLSGAASAVQRCSLFQGGQLGALAGDPLLTANPRGDYRLGAGSPAIDACGVGPVRDLDGNSRDATSDIGAFEFGGALPDAIFADGFESP